MSQARQTEMSLVTATDIVKILASSVPLASYIKSMSLFLICTMRIIK